MTTITETITGKLLDAIQDPVVLQAVLQEYSHNKGPLYIALAQATSVLTQKLTATALQYKELETKLQERQQQIQEREQKLHGLDQQVASQSSKLASLETKVQESATLLDKVNSLTVLGFGPDELGKLHHLLMDNIPEGGKPQDAIVLFFKFVDAYPHLATIDGEVQEKEQLLASLDGKIQAKQALLDEVQTIGGLGLGTKQLAKLHNLLVKSGASQGIEAQEITKMFFDYAGKFQDAVALDTHIHQLQTATATAQAETEHWQAQAKAVEAKTKARKASIDITEKLLAHGVKERDLPHWMHILEKAGVSVEELSQGLDQFAALEKLIQNRQQKADKLETSIKSLTAQVNALADERQEVSASISILKKGALAELEKMSQKTLDNIDHLAAKSGENIGLQQQNTTKAIEAVRGNTQAAVEAISKKVLEEMQSFVNQATQYAVLERQAGVLSQELVIARALKSQDLEQWKKLSFHSIREMLNGIILWSRADTDHNPYLLSPPYPLSSKITFYSMKSASLDEVLAWALTGVYSETERKAATHGYLLLETK